MKKLVLIFIMALMIPYFGFSQSAHSHRYQDEKLKEYTDSLKRTPYPFFLPALGRAVQKKGFDIPRPWGAMLNYSLAHQAIGMEQLAVGLSPETLIDVSNIVEIPVIEPTVNVVSFRPDVFIFPFLGISGLFGKYYSDTYVEIDYPFDLKFNTKGEGRLLGFGTTVAGGVGPIFFNYSFNGTWAKGDKSLKSNFTTTNGIRLGHQAKNHRNPQRAWTLWLGAEHIHMAPQTLAYVDLDDLLGISPEDKERASQELDDWYNGLPELEQRLFEGLYNSISGWLNNGETDRLYYDFEKYLITPWNVVIGGQYQLNKHWWFTLEGTFGGTRWRTVASVAYRFGLKEPKSMGAN